MKNSLDLKIIYKNIGQVLLCSPVLFYYLIIYKMLKISLLEKAKQQRYLYGMCQMTNYMPENEDLFYNLDGESLKELFERLKGEVKRDKEIIKKQYKNITEIVMFANWKGWYYSENGEYNKSEEVIKVWQKMNDYFANRYDYDTEEGKYYFRTLD